MRSKKSLDSGVSSGKGASGERPSIFGASFSGALGKSRKPPPKYSTAYFFPYPVVPKRHIQRSEFSLLNGALTR
jgi:hypothetical protein